MTNGKDNDGKGVQHSGRGNGKQPTALTLRSWSVGFFNGPLPTDGQLRAYEQAVRLNPRKAWYRSRLAKAFWALGMVEEALEHFEKACELMPHEPFYRLELAEAYLALNRLDDAIAQLEQVVEWAPYDDYYHIRLAAAYLRAHRWSDAIQVLEGVVRLHPFNASYRFLLGLLYLAVGEQESATLHLKSVGSWTSMTAAFCATSANFAGAR
jgi:tetratricopeptide (TPR) repeat protein